MLDSQDDLLDILDEGRKTAPKDEINFKEYKKNNNNKSGKNTQNVISQISEK